MAKELASTCYFEIKSNEIIEEKFFTTTSKAQTLSKSNALDEFPKHDHLKWNRNLNKRKDLY